MKYIIIIISVWLVGCKCPQCDNKPDQEFKPLPPLKFDNLLFPHLGDIAYKSVTKKDYECEEEC